MQNFQFKSRPLVITSILGNENSDDVIDKLGYFTKLSSDILLFLDFDHEAVKLQLENKFKRFNLYHFSLEQSSLLEIFNQNLSLESLNENKADIANYIKFELFYRARMKKTPHYYFCWIDYDLISKIDSLESLPYKFIWPTMPQTQLSGVLNFSGGKNISSAINNPDVLTQKDIDLYFSIFCMDSKTISDIYFKTKNILLGHINKTKNFLPLQNILLSQFLKDPFRNYFSVSVDPKSTIPGQSLFEDYLSY